MNLANPEILDRIPDTGRGVHVILSGDLTDRDVIAAWLATRDLGIRDAAGRKFLLSIIEWPLWFSNPGCSPATFAASKTHETLVPPLAAHYLAVSDPATLTIRLTLLQDDYQS